MTVREALREPISLQALICLTVGVFLGVASCLVPALLLSTAGPEVECRTVSRK